VNYVAQNELLRTIQPYKDVMIPYSVKEDDMGTITKDVYAAFIDRVTVEVIDNEGRRIGIVGGVIEDGGCTRAVPIYPRDFITSGEPIARLVWNKGQIADAIELLVDYGRICVRPQGRSYVVGVFNCMKFDSCPTRVVQKRPGDWDDFFLRELVISAKDYWSEIDAEDFKYSTSTPGLPLPSMIRRPVTPFRDRDYCNFHCNYLSLAFARAQNIIFQKGPVGPYRWNLNKWNRETESDECDKIVAAARLYAQECNAPFGCRRDVLPEFLSYYEWCLSLYLL
jgi:hypothetical protein